jgi:hypothetical protein
LGFVSSSAQAAPDAPTTQPAQFMRFLDRGDKGGELDTADAVYTNGNGVTIHLVAAVHIGEKAYYDELSKEFEGYDAVLYELIKPKDSAAPGGDGAGERSQSMISEFQVFLKQMLNLDFQLDDIDYTKPNFVHADLDKETFEKMEADRGESIWTLMLQQALNSLGNPPATQPGADDDSTQEMIRMVCRPDGERQFKLTLARDMSDMESISIGLNGPGGTVILTERNKAAIAALTQTLAAGKTNIAIFYGAAHMPDLSDRLAQMGFTPVKTDWHMAWDLTIRPDQPSMADKFVENLIKRLGGSN